MSVNTALVTCSWLLFYLHTLRCIPIYHMWAMLNNMIHLLIEKKFKHTIRINGVLRLYLEFSQPNA